ncbi:hypothetical protein FOA43_004196 [Brettanomyces nanus]|uniref:Uncharacterized protein n=1 Tax=Eeniella nana TaxID=13502 RepID=A0A875SAJ3_EENNA|nr:uncharacterized protein FOA43_004196 [Brettanomyces nanus]QPG76802.1 hypothetical protein FOA43_004196 [Brettanomyces nanus]
MLANRLRSISVIQVRSYVSLGGEGKPLDDLMSKLSNITKNANEERLKNKSSGSNGDKQYQRKKEAKKATIQRKRSRFSRNNGGNDDNRGNRRRNYGNGNGSRNGGRNYDGNRSRGGQKLNLEAQTAKAEANVKAIYEHLMRTMGTNGKGDGNDTMANKSVLDIFMKMEKVKEKDLNEEEGKARSEFIRRKLRSELQPLGYSHKSVKKGLANQELLRRLSSLQDYSKGYSIYQPEFPNVAELQLTKTKIAYSANNRVLLALEQIAAIRGYKLKDTYKMQPILPASANLYPFCNTLIPGNLARPKSDLRSFDDVPESEIRATINYTVRGIRPELKVDPKKQYKTPQMELNAHVVVNSLNSNAQLKVDNIHLPMSKVLIGDGKLSELPKKQN